MLDRDQPARLLQPENIDAHLQLYEPLIGYVGALPDGAGSAASRTLTPLVAEAWASSADRTTYRITVRHGMRSSFGNELTASDVCWAWERSLALGTVGAWIASNAGITSADQIRQLDRYTVQFQLPYGTTILPHLLTVIVPTIFDSTEARRHTTPADPWAIVWLRDHGAGFGPYTVATKTDASLTLVANPNYWRGVPQYESVEFVEIPEKHQRMKCVSSGECHVAVGLDEVPAAGTGAVAYRLPTSWRTMLGVTYLRSPFNQAAFRRGLAMAIPYERIVSEGYLGQAKLMTSCISDLVTGHSPEFDLHYSPNEARELLRPYLPLPPVPLTYHAESPAFPRIATILEESLEAVGLDIELDLVDAGDHGIRKLRRELDLFIDEDGPITIDGRYALGHDINPPLEGVFDFIGYHSEEVNHLLTLSLRELDQHNTLRLLRQVQANAARDLPWIPLAQQEYVLWFHSAISGYRWYPLPRIRLRDLIPASEAADSRGMTLT
ncbi:MAG: ABC transporter substrate-binding protein [Candidatus Dormibacteraceae bacterium]